MTKPTAKRTGRSLLKTINTAPAALIRTVGFTAEQAKRILSVRRTLPLVEDRKAPSIDARKLWAKIGKPYGRFNDWASHHIKPLMLRQNLNTEISVFEDSSKPGKPAKQYTLSRDIAAHLAMMANTPQGEEVRTYFLDMEDLALKLSKHLAVRVVALVEIDNKVTHLFTVRAGDKAKAGNISKAAVRSTANDMEALLKSTVCEVTTGHPAGHWRACLGGHKGVRDVLDTQDVKVYAACYETAQAFIQAGIRGRDKLMVLLAPAYGARVDASKYLPM